MERERGSEKRKGVRENKREREIVIESFCNVF